MFKKLHLQFTIFCTIITGSILIAMACVCLYIARMDTLDQSYFVFRSNINSFLSYLEDQPVISHRWMREIEKNYNLQISILDGNSPLFFHQLSPCTDQELLFESALRQAEEEYDFPTDKSSGSRKLTEHVEFHLRDIDHCYASVAAVPREQGNLNVIALYHLDREYRSIHRRQCLSAAAILAAILLLAIFSWFFTRTILAPVKQNRQQQTEFIAAASHELRTPLSVILSGLSAMDGAAPEMQQHFSAIIQEECQRMKRLIDDMLLLANADNKSWSFHPGPTEPDTLLLNIFEKYLPAAKQKGISMDIRLPIEHIQTEAWDKDRIIQVLEILIDNALHYTPKDGRILLNLAIRGNEAEYRIADNGPGISDSEKSAVFQRFYRCDSSHCERDHFGLGLCIAEEIIRIHRGQIRIQDTPGGGATFIVTLLI